ncbi:DUF2149 domain-containing protein [uncultured Zhongshania sp.]|uniref:DUF2149 domain-containing protein n=1 Tax=uncultured Zhongshania sp. TaxID=1642288 RepID=UPI0025E6A431|nr:DUF2149 domain-containing protein [uncultured Zhongshania sp.]
MDKWRDSEFLESDEDPLGPMANLVDIILVFACGLIAALVSFSPDLQQHFSTEKIDKDISLGKELPTVPKTVQDKLNSGSGYEAMGQVYRDPETGKLILIGE